MASDCSGKFCFAIDRGGTFTDIYARCPKGTIRIMKLLSEDPQNYPDAPREGIRRILSQVMNNMLTPKMLDVISGQQSETLGTRHYSLRLTHCTYLFVVW